MNPLILVYLWRWVISALAGLLAMAVCGACCGLVIGTAVVAYRCVVGALP